MKILILRMTEVILVILSVHCVEKIWIIASFIWEDSFDIIVLVTFTGSKNEKEQTRKYPSILLELSGQLLALLRGDVVFSFGFQVGERLLVQPHVNLTQGVGDVQIS